MVGAGVSVPANHPGLFLNKEGNYGIFMRSGKLQAHAIYARSKVASFPRKWESSSLSWRGPPLVRG